MHSLDLSKRRSRDDLWPMRRESTPPARKTGGLAEWLASKGLGPDGRQINERKVA